MNQAYRGTLLKRLAQFYLEQMVPNAKYIDDYVSNYLFTDEKIERYGLLEAYQDYRDGRNWEVSKTYLKGAGYNPRNIDEFADEYVNNDSVALWDDTDEIDFENLLICYKNWRAYSIDDIIRILWDTPYTANSILKYLDYEAGKGFDAGRIYLPGTENEELEEVIRKAVAKIRRKEK